MENHFLFIRATAGTAGAALTGLSSFTGDAFLVDLVVACCGGLAATALTETWTGKLHELVIGVALGVLVAIIFRSGDSPNDTLVRTCVGIAALLSTRGVLWIKNPAASAKDWEAIKKVVQFFLPWLRGK